MICKKCKTENPEDAVYCKNCGKKLDEKNLCPACGYENADDALFCNQCGTCLTEPAAAEKPKRKAQSATADDTANGWNWRKIVELCGGIFAMCGIFCVLLCTFLLGVTVTGTQGALSQYVATESQNIYYYFGEAYDDISQTLTTLVYYSGTMELSLYVPVVFGTVIAAGTIVAVLTLSVLAAVRYGLKAAGKSEKDYAPYAAAAILSFVIGSVLLYAINSASVSMIYRSDYGISSESEEISASVALNGAGVAGIVCGLVCLGVFLACRVAQKGTALGTKESVLKLCFTVGALALIGVVLGVSSMPGFSAYSQTKSSYSYQSTTIQMSLFTGGLFVVMQAEGSTALPEPSGEYLLAMFAQIMQFAVVILAVIALLSRVNHLSSDKKRSGLPFAIALAACALAYLILDIFAVQRSLEFLEITESLQPKYVYAIVLLVFAVLNLAATIVYKVLGCRKKAE